MLCYVAIIDKNEWREKEATKKGTMHTNFKRIVSTYDIYELSQIYSSNTAHAYGPIHCVVCCMRDRHLSKYPSVSINPFFASYLAI